jgi:hypothetical protein
LHKIFFNDGSGRRGDCGGEKIMIMKEMVVR